jgi:hypothetical protein
VIAWLWEMQANRTKRPEINASNSAIITGVIQPMNQYDNQYEKLLNWLNKLNDNEFRIMIRTLLTVEQQNTLPLPVERVDRGSFLGNMQVYEWLDDVEHYLCRKYPNRFRC